MERIDDTGFGGLRLIQDTDGFCYGVDAVLLADFSCSICNSFGLAVDLGSGNGIIPFIMSHKNKNAEFIGLELQQAAVELAQRSCALNGLETRISFIRGDVADVPSGCAEMKMTLGGRKVDIVTCNPPYFIKGGGVPAETEGRFTARHETTAGIDGFVAAAAALLKNKGHFFLVHRPSRLADIFCACRKYKLEPKDMRLVAPKAGEAPNIVFLHCVAGGGAQLTMMNELYVYDENGEYTDEIMRIYERV